MPATSPRRPRPRGRPPIHLSLSLNLVLPSQFFPDPRGKAAGTGERRLILAVLHDAIGIVLKHAGARNARCRRLFLETVEWFTADDMESSFSFMNVCEVLGLDPGCLRRRVATQLAGVMPNDDPDPALDSRTRSHPGAVNVASTLLASASSGETRPR